MSNDPKDTIVDMDKLSHKINYIPNASTLRKCSGFYTKFNGKVYERHNFEIGYFHRFGCNFEEFENGLGNYTTAIVELPHGELVEAVVNSIKFLE